MTVELALLSQVSYGRLEITGSRLPGLLALLAEDRTRVQHLPAGGRAAAGRATRAPGQGGPGPCVTGPGPAHGARSGIHCGSTAVSLPAGGAPELPPGRLAGWETTGVFVADDLVGWLIGQLADAGYQQLITRLRGSDQERALKPAVTAAVTATADEVSPASQRQAVAEQIGQAFGKRRQVPLPRGMPTLLDALQAGIAGQLSVLDDAGRLVVRVPGVPVSEVAAKLTYHLVREIIFRGTESGPLTPLANQLNHDLTHGALAHLTALVSGTRATTGGAVGPVGWPPAEETDPIAPMVHHPVQPDVGARRRPVKLPAVLVVTILVTLAAPAAVLGMKFFAGHSPGKAKAHMTGPSPSGTRSGPLDSPRGERINAYSFSLPSDAYSPLGAARPTLLQVMAASARGQGALQWRSADNPDQFNSGNGDYMVLLPRGTAPTFAACNAQTDPAQSVLAPAGRAFCEVEPEQNIIAIVSVASIHPSIVDLKITIWKYFS